MSGRGSNPRRWQTALTLSKLSHRVLCRTGPVFSLCHCEEHFAQKPSVQKSRNRKFAVILVRCQPPFLVFARNQDDCSLRNRPRRKRKPQEHNSTIRGIFRYELLHFTMLLLTEPIRTYKSISDPKTRFFYSREAASHYALKKL